LLPEPVAPAEAHECEPAGVGGQDPGVAEDDEALFGAGDGDIELFGFADDADSADFVGVQKARACTRRANDDELAFEPLKGLHGSNIQAP